MFAVTLARMWRRIAYGTQGFIYFLTRRRIVRDLECDRFAHCHKMELTRRNRGNSGRCDDEPQL